MYLPCSPLLGGSDPLSSIKISSRVACTGSPGLAYSAWLLCLLDCPSICTHIHTPTGSVLLDAFCWSSDYHRLAETFWFRNSAWFALHCTSWVFRILRYVPLSPWPSSRTLHTQPHNLNLTLTLTRTLILDLILVSTLCSVNTTTFDPPLVRLQQTRRTATTEPCQLINRSAAVSLSLPLRPTFSASARYTHCYERPSASNTHAHTLFSIRPHADGSNVHRLVFKLGPSPAPSNPPLLASSSSLEPRRHGLCSTPLISDRPAAYFQLVAARAVERRHGFVNLKNLIRNSPSDS